MLATIYETTAIKPSLIITLARVCIVYTRCSTVRIRRNGIDLYLICFNGGFACGALHALRTTVNCFTPLYTEYKKKKKKEEEKIESNYLWLRAGQERIL